MIRCACFGGQARAVEMNIRVRIFTGCPNCFVVGFNQKFVAVGSCVIICFVIAVLCNIFLIWQFVHIIAERKLHISISILRPVKRRKILVGKSARGIMHEIQLIGAFCGRVVFAHPGPIKLDLSGKHRQKIDRVSRRILHFFCTAKLCDASDTKSRVSADDLHPDRIQKRIR